MGTRYDFELTINLKEDIPEGIIRLVAFLMRQGGEPPSEAPDDPFFGCDWRKYPFAAWVTTYDPHAGDAVCSFRRVYRYTLHGEDHYQYTLHLRFCAKLETVVEEGLSFAMWLAKWSDQNECVGHYKGEDSRHPTLLYFHEGELYLREVSEAPRRATDGAFWK
jgi:hypothetical protein